MPIIVPDARIYECDVCRKDTVPHKEVPEGWIVVGDQCYCPEHNDIGLTEAIKDITSRMTDRTGINWHTNPHEEGEDLLCELVTLLGFPEIVEIFREIKK